MKGTSLRSIARYGSVSSAILLFAVAGQAMAAVTTGTIMGKLTLPAGQSLDQSAIVATSDTYNITRADVNADGTYSLDVDPGTYTVAVVADGFDATPVANVVVAAGMTVPEDFTLKVAAPFPVVKSASPIPLTDDINSASFMDAPEIDLNMGQNVTVYGGGDVTNTPLGNAWSPQFASGRFRIKYSAQAIHVAGDVTYMLPRLNNQPDANNWNGNAFEFGFQDNPYDPTLTSNDPDHDWQLIVGLGATPDWWLDESIGAAPTVNGTAEPLNSHFMIQDKPATAAGGTSPGELFRLDIPWSILLDSSGKPISAPADNAFGAMDVVMDAAGPADDLTTAVRSLQLGWGGYPRFQTFPNQLRPIQFATQAPAAATPSTPSTPSTP